MGLHRRFYKKCAPQFQYADIRQLLCNGIIYAFFLSLIALRQPSLKPPFHFLMQRFAQVADDIPSDGLYKIIILFFSRKDFNAEFSLSPVLIVDGRASTGLNQHDVLHNNAAKLKMTCTDSEVATK